MIRFEKSPVAAPPVDKASPPAEPTPTEVSDAANNKAARHKKSDTDGTLRRERQALEDNRLI